MGDYSLVMRMGDHEVTVSVAGHANDHEALKASRQLTGLLEAATFDVVAAEAELLAAAGQSPDY